MDKMVISTAFYSVKTLSIIERIPKSWNTRRNLVSIDCKVVADLKRKREMGVYWQKVNQRRRNTYGSQKRTQQNGTSIVAEIEQQSWRQVSVLVQLVVKASSTLVESRRADAHLHQAGRNPSPLDDMEKMEGMKAIDGLVEPRQTS